MKLIQIKIQTSRESEDALSNLLIEMGSGGVQTDDAPASDRVTVIAYFPSDDMIGQRVSKIKGFLEELRDLNIDTGDGRISLKALDEQDWTKPWREFFRPLLIGRRILVYPSWESAEVWNSICLRSPTRDIFIQIDPGMAFGTGRHSTTILCLEMLEDALKGGDTILDVGTGSGILAIAAVKLGAKNAVGIEVGEKAATIARENSVLNGVSNRIHLICSDRPDAVRDKYDVIVSNISTRIILPMIPDFRSHLHAGSRLILSGILDDEIQMIQNGLDNNRLVTLEIRRNEEWAAFMASLPG